MKSGENGLIGPGDNNYGQSDSKRKRIEQSLNDSYIINPKFKHGDTIYFFAKDIGITKMGIGAIHAMLRENGTYVVFYTSNEKKKYKQPYIVEEYLAFKTPEEVAAQMVEKFKTFPDEKQDNI